MLDFTNVKESNSFEPVPVGKYNVQCTEAAIKDAKSGGKYVNAKFKITEGPQQGKYIFQTFTIENQNAKAVEIGMGQLKTFMRCAGFSDMKLASVTDLEGHIANATVKHKVDDYGTKAVISYFQPVKEDVTKETTPF